MAEIGYGAYLGILAAGGPAIVAAIIGTHAPAIYNFVFHPMIENKIIEKHGRRGASSQSLLNNDSEKKRLVSAHHASETRSSKRLPEYYQQ